MFSENGEGTRTEEMHGKKPENNNVVPADGTEVGDNQEKQKQEEQEKQKQEELEKIEAQKREQEKRNNQARIDAQKIPQTTSAPASNPNSKDAQIVTGELHSELDKTFP